MNIQTIAEHKVDLDLLPEKSYILDLGCLGFVFTHEMQRRGHIVYPVDIQILDAGYYRVAITNYDGYGYVINNSDKQAVRFTMDAGIHDLPGDSERIHCEKLSTFMKRMNVDFFDYIKTDVEGSEREIIMSLEKAPSTQFEVEFHRHTGIYGDGQIDEMVLKLESLGYETVIHEKTSQHGLAPNYWSSLFVLKDGKGS